MGTREDRSEDEKACRGKNGTESSTGQVLTSPQVIEIYKHKLRLLRPSTFESCLQSSTSRIKGQSVPVASLFGVSPKTVRDIWNRRTWAYATNFLWAEEECTSIENIPAGGVSQSVTPVRIIVEDTSFMFKVTSACSVSQMPETAKRPRGRPKGSRDTKPRIRPSYGPVRPIQPLPPNHHHQYSKATMAHNRHASPEFTWHRLPCPPQGDGARPHGAAPHPCWDPADSPMSSSTRDSTAPPPAMHRHLPSWLPSWPQQQLHHHHHHHHHQPPPPPTTTTTTSTRPVAAPARWLAGAEAESPVYLSVSPPPPPAASDKPPTAAVDDPFHADWPHW